MQELSAYFGAYSVAIVFISVLFTSNANANDTVLTVPIVIDITTLEKKLNKTIPQVLVNQPAKRHVCAPAKWFTSSWLGIKTKITPEISCDVSGAVKRTTPIKLIASGGSLLATASLVGSATVKGRGSLGKHIRETAHGSLTVTIKITPSINTNWKVSAGAQISHKWIQRPKAKLFNLIPITFGSEADKEINKLKKTLVPEIDKQLNAFDIKGQLADMWNNLQVPQLIAASPKTYLQLQPKEIGISKLETNVKQISLTVFVRSLTEIVLGTPRSRSRTALPKLSRIPSSDSVLSLSVPIRASFDDLSEILAEEFDLPGERKVDGVFGHTFWLRYGTPELQRENNESIRVSIPAEINTSGKTPSKFRVELTAEPVVNWANRSVLVKISSSDIYIGTTSESSILYKLLFAGIAKKFEKELVVSFGNALSKIEQQVANYRNTTINKNLRIKAGTPRYSYDGFKVDSSGASVIVGLTGDATIHFIP